MKKIILILTLLILSISAFFILNKIQNSTKQPKNSTHIIWKKLPIIHLQDLKKKMPIEVTKEEIVNNTQHINDIISEYLLKEGLKQNQVAFSYYNTTTNAYAHFNERQIMTLGSTYKLPLNMVVTDKINQKLFSDNTIIRVRTLDNRQDEEYLEFIEHYGKETSIYNLQTTSLIYSNNTSSESLIMLLGGWGQMIREIQKYGFYISFNDNSSSTLNFIEGMRYLYNNADSYTAIIERLLIANPNEFYQSVSSDIAIAHKYGLYADAQNDIAIVYSEEPYLIVLFTSNLTYKQFCEVSDLIHSWHTYNEKANS